MTLVVLRQHVQQRVVKDAGLVESGRAAEFVVEAEIVEERAQPRIHVVADSSHACRTDRESTSAACRDWPPSSPCSARCPALCAGRPCRRTSRSAASSYPATSSGMHGAPRSCARLRRRCRYAAGRTGRSRSRTRLRLRTSPFAARRSSRATTLRASSNGQARAAKACIAQSVAGSHWNSLTLSVPKGARS